MSSHPHLPLSPAHAHVHTHTYTHCIFLMQAGKDVRFGDWNAREVEYLNEYQLLTGKPVVYLVNVSKVRPTGSGP